MMRRSTRTTTGAETTITLSIPIEVRILISELAIVFFKNKRDMIAVMNDLCPLNLERRSQRSTPLSKNYEDNELFPEPSNNGSLDIAGAKASNYTYMDARYLSFIKINTKIQVSVDIRNR